MKTTLIKIQKFKTYQDTEGSRILKQLIRKK